MLVNHDGVKVDDYKYLTAEEYIWPRPPSRLLRAVTVAAIAATINATGSSST